VRDGDRAQGRCHPPVVAGRLTTSDLVLALADNKQMLGLRYAEWATRAPSLEADIAAAAMGLDDLGHSRVLYGCLEPLGAEPRGPERESDPASIRNIAYFDDPWTEWSQFVAANAILDTAFTAMIEACVNGSVEVLRHRLRKMLTEERYHFLHGRSWLRSGIEAAPLLRAWQEALEFFGPPDSNVEGLSMGPAELRARLEERLEIKAPDVTIHWEMWDPLRRRTAPGAIDAHTFGMLRGLEEKKYAPPAASRQAAR
jgi:ring-1,2-phenylacetyl-CoA epoxidase subunit PaaC